MNPRLAFNYLIHPSNEPLIRCQNVIVPSNDAVKWTPDYVHPRWDFANLIEASNEHLIRSSNEPQITPN